MKCELCDKEAINVHVEYINVDVGDTFITKKPSGRQIYRCPDHPGKPIVIQTQKHLLYEKEHQG